MKLITRYELAAYNDEQLYAALRTTFNALIRTGYGSPERRNALASIENIQREIGSRNQP